MMNILLDFMHFARHLVNTKYLVDDIKNLVVKNDKIQAAAGEHDDCVMSWLIAMYVYYYGEQLERYGFVKGSVPEDVAEDDEFKKLSLLYRNPEIKKQFPTMYAYYKEQKAKHDMINRATMEETQSKYKPFNIGGLGDVKVTDVPDIDAFLDREKKNDSGNKNGPNKGPKAPPAVHVDI